jgi:putative FmdB family regulatory protein
VPTYQYACTECGHGFEAVQSFTDDALTQCPQCTGRLRKVFNSVGVVFKGTGFYRTDSREAAKASSNGKGTGDAKPAEKKSDGGSKTESASSSSATTSPTATSTASGTSSTKGSAA